MTLSEVFWIAFIGTASGLLIKIASMILKSKCSDCSFCGITIKRDVALEEKENEFEEEESSEDETPEEMIKDGGLGASLLKTNDRKS